MLVGFVFNVTVLLSACISKYLC